MRVLVRIVIGVACKRRVQGAVGDIHQRVAHGHSHVSNIGIEQGATEAVPEAKDGQSDQRNASQDEPGPVFAPLGVALVHQGTHHRVPQHVHQTDDQEHHGGHVRIEAEHVGIVEKEPDTDGLVDQVLGHVSGPETDPLQPAQLVKAFCLRSLYIHGLDDRIIFVVLWPTVALSCGWMSFHSPRSALGTRYTPATFSAVRRCSFWTRFHPQS